MRWRQRDWVALLLAGATIFVSAFAIGSVTRWGTCLAAALAVASFAPLLRATRVPVGRSPLVGFLGIAFLFTALQYVPLPAWLVRHVAPATYDVLAGNAAVLGNPPPRWAALSLDRHGTLLELCKLAAYLAFAAACLRLATMPTGRRRLVTFVAGTGVALAVVAWAHHLVGAQRLFGLYAPVDAQPPPPYLAPLINANHLSGYLAMVTPCVLALALMSKGPARMLWIGGAVMTASVALLARSRAGSVALTVGMAAGVLLWWLGVRRRARGPYRKQPASVTAAMAVVALCGLALVGALSAGGVVQEFAATRRSEFRDPRSKFAAWTSASTLLRDNRWTGVGRGAFEPAFTRVHEPSRELTFSRLENEYLQAAVEWGLPAAAVLALALIGVAILAWRRWHEGPLEAGVIGGLIAVAVHNGADFALELPAMALPTIALLAVVTHRPLGSAPAERPRRRQALRAAAWAAAVLVVLAAASPLARTLREEGDRLRTLADDHDVPRATVVAAAREAMKEHPADYYPAAVMARALADQGQHAAVAFLNRALLLHPTHPGLHLLAARTLYRFDHADQALVEYSLALQDGAKPADVLPELLARYKDAAVIARGIPRRADLILGLARELTARGRSDVAIVVCRRAIELGSRDVQVLRYLSTLLGVSGDATAAVEVSQRAYDLAPSSGTALTLAAALAAADRTAEAIRILGEAREMAARTTSHQDDIDVLNQLSAAAFKLARYGEAKAAMAEMLQLAGPDRKLRALAHHHLAEIETALGNAHQAAWELSRARELEAP